MIRTLGALLLLLSAPVVAAAQESGRVEGVASISSRLVRPRQRVRVYDEPGSPPPETAASANPFGNVVLYLQSANPLRGRAQPAGPVPEMRQHGEQFVPHVLPIVAGTTVDFPNDDPIYHNVFSLSRVRSFDLGRYPRGSSKSIQFARAGVVQVFCHIHADMSGYILVLDNPFFVVPDSAGHFTLDGVPPGDYTLVAWHERIRPLEVPLHVASGRTTNLQLRIPLPDSGQVR
jgi:plastocyanin